MLNGKNILLGVTGGIAVYKAAALTSKLVQQGASVKVMMSESATKFVAPLTFQALSRHPIYTDTFDEKDPEKIAHIDLADWADMVVLAPATANVIGKLANGIADDMITTTLLATEAPIYVAPAMNVHMYANQAVQKNMQTLVSYGYRFIEPGEGYLACGYVGKGRLEEPETIVDLLQSDQTDRRLFKDKKILITAGPTQEIIDPVRFFTNHSSGKMGYALAEKAVALGAEVTLVSGPVSLNCPKGVNRIMVTSAHDMYDTVLAHFNDADIVIKAAAVADYRPKVFHTNKLKKQKGDLTLEMERTIDILKTLGTKKSHQFLVGFAAETDQPIEYGKEKLHKKNLDAIVVNNVSQEGAGFKGDTNIVTYINKYDKEVQLPKLSKLDVANEVLHFIYEDYIKDDLQ